MLIEYLYINIGLQICSKRFKVYNASCPTRFRAPSLVNDSMISTMLSLRQALHSFQ